MSDTIEIPLMSQQEHTVVAHGPPAHRSFGYAPRQLPFGLAIFVSAFLLFQVQLFLGRQILPLFGGTPAVWTVCVLVFQLLFLAGYGYSHGIATWVPLRGQILIHGALLGISALFLLVLGRFWSTPISPGADWRPASGASPTWVIAEFLIRSIGLPFFLLSATSPLFQHWFGLVAPKSSPYRLYALSNAGSLLGLLSYPLLIEPNWGLHTQGWAWTAGFASFLVCFYFTARETARQQASAARQQESAAHHHTHGIDVKWSSRLLWISLAACASILLLATTNLICQDITVSPFLWVSQLSLYLLSFILCFESDRWYRREVFYPLFAVTVASAIVVSLPNANPSYLMLLAAYSAALFAGCMVCHGEAARARPSKESLTDFYFCIGIGGAVGGIVVSLIAPRIFPSYWEYPLGILGCIAVVLSVSARERSSWWYTGRASLAYLILAGVAILTPIVLGVVWKPAAHLPQSAWRYTAGTLAVVAIFLYARERRTPDAIPAPFLVRSSARIALALLTAGLVIPQKAAFYDVIVQSRNFYGVLSVISVQDENYLALRYGSILHGFQYQDPQRARLATGYYGPGSGANIVIRNWPHRPMRVGLVGMGVGTLEALSQTGDVFRFYEINPDVYKWSSGEHPHFTYLSDSPGRIEVVLGDARVSLEREAGRGDFQRFDVLVLDAFSSGAIPMHLLTSEAFSIYEKQLRGPESVIAVHISSHDLDLRPVLAGISLKFGFHAVRVYPLLPGGPFSQSDWILLSHDPASLSGVEMAKKSEAFPAEVRPIFWTDDYCDLFHVTRWRD